MRFESRILVAGSLIGVVAFLYQSRNVPERAVGFSQPNAEIVSYELFPETAGDVISIDRLTSDVDSIINKDGNIIYNGDVSYRIRPQWRFEPHGEIRTDLEGNAPWNNDYWHDIRRGNFTVTFDN